MRLWQDDYYTDREHEAVRDLADDAKARTQAEDFPSTMWEAGHKHDPFDDDPECPTCQAEEQKDTNV